MKIETIYPDQFQKLVEMWDAKYPDKTDKHSYIGVGNPNAKILFVGREGTTDETVEQIEERETAFAHYWLEKITNNQPPLISSSYPVSERGYVSNGHTWVKYQKLYDLISRPGQTQRYGKGCELDFLEYVFTTEMNPNRAPKTNGVPTDGMPERKKHFFTSEFIQQFPIVVLACGFNYIQNRPGNWEINNLFGVEYVQTLNDGRSDSGLQFYAHYNSDRTKLVVNTRQLSGQINGALLEYIAELCRPFYTDTDAEK